MTVKDDLQNAVTRLDEASDECARAGNYAGASFYLIQSLKIALVVEALKQRRAETGEQTP